MTNRNIEKPLKAPFPYFGGKSLIAADVWRLFGPIKNYVEPFAGSLAVLLARPTPFAGPETVNDWSCHLVNAWRAIQSKPEELAELCVGVVAEVNTEAQHFWLLRRADELRDQLGDPSYCDLHAAAYYIKGACEWICSGWCSGDGPWQWDGVWSKSNSGRGVKRKLPHLADSGCGVNRQHLGESTHAGRVAWVSGWLCSLRDRLTSVRITCGDWKRVANSRTTTIKHGLTGIFLDPPYDGTEYVYGSSIPISQEVRQWCIDNASEPNLRIIVCGRGKEHDELIDFGYKSIRWKTRRGYSNKKDNDTETLWTKIPDCEDDLFQS